MNLLPLPSPVRIVHYLKWLRLQDGGVVRAVLDLSAALARAGHDVILLSADDSGVPAEWKKPTLESPATPGLPRSVLLTLTDPLDTLRGRKTINATADTPTQRLPKDSLATASRAIRSADVLHLHGPWTPSNHALARVAERAKVPFVLSAHGMLDEWCMRQGALKKRIALALFATKTMNAAHALHFTASAERDQASKVVSANAIAKSAVIPLVFDTSLFASLPGPQLARETFKLSPSQPLFLFLSRIHEKKGVETLLRAAAKILPHHPNFTLVIAGPSDPPNYVHTIKALAASLGLANKVIFPGLVSGPLKISLYQAATAFVLPTQQENFGFVLIESLLANTPVITTKAVDIWPELQQSGGATITDGTIDSIASALINAIAPTRTTGPHEAALPSSARNWATEYVDESRIVKQFESLYSRQAASKHQ